MNPIMKPAMNPAHPGKCTGPLIGLRYPVTVRPRNLENRKHTGNTNSGHMK